MGRKGVNRMNNERLFMSAINAAACWWAYSAKNATEEQRDAFKDALRERLLEVVRKQNDPAFGIVLMNNTLGLDSLVRESADVAGISCTDFPERVSMLVEYDVVSVSDGVVKPYRDIYVRGPI